MRKEAWRGLLLGFLVLIAVFPAVAAGRPRETGLFKVQVHGEIELSSSLEDAAYVDHWLWEPTSRKYGWGVGYIEGGEYTFSGGASGIVEFYDDMDGTELGISHYYSIYQDYWVLVLHWYKDYDGYGIKEKINLVGVTCTDVTPEGTYNELTATWTVDSRFDVTVFVQFEETVPVGKSGQTKTVIQSIVLWQGPVTIQCIIQRIG